MVRIVYSQAYNSRKEIVNICVEEINNRKIVVLPTETVYGIIGTENLVDKLYRIKMRRERFTVHAADLYQILSKYEIKEKYINILKKLFPGPVTTVVETETGERVGLRVPDHDLVREVLKEIGPAFMPSANRKDEPSPIVGRDVYDNMLDAVDLIIDEGYTKYCMDSTVIDLTGDIPEVIRTGAFPIKNLEKIVGKSLKIPNNILSLIPFSEKKYLKNRLSIMVKSVDNIDHISIDISRCIILISLENYYEHYRSLERKCPIVLIYGSEKNILSMYRGVYECLRLVEKFPDRPVIIVPPVVSYDTLPVIERFLRAVDRVM